MLVLDSRQKVSAQMYIVRAINGVLQALQMIARKYRLAVKSRQNMQGSDSQ